MNSVAGSNHENYVLLVDDDDILRHLYAAYLQRRGYKIGEASRGQQARCVNAIFIPETLTPCRRRSFSLLSCISCPLARPWDAYEYRVCHIQWTGCVNSVYGDGSTAACPTPSVRCLGPYSGRRRKYIFLRKTQFGIQVVILTQYLRRSRLLKKFGIQVQQRKQIWYSGSKA